MEEYEKPWQDRRTLFSPAHGARGTAPRRLAHGFRPSAKTMKDNPHV
jgi:hypothetical protein